MLFGIILKNFDMLGISAKQSKKSNPINARIFAGLVALFCNVLFQLLFIANEAQEFQEYIQSIYMSSIGTLSFFSLAMMVVQMDSFFEFIENIHKLLIKIENDKGENDYAM